MMFETKWPSRAFDELQALLDKESHPAYGTIPNRFSRSGNSASVAQYWRHRVTEWCYKFVDDHKFDREVVSVALNYVDRYIFKQTSHDTITQEMYQLIAVTSLYLAIKVHGVAEDTLPEYRASFISKTLHKLCYGIYDPQFILEMELEIICVLNWHINPPTMHQMVLTCVHLLALRNETHRARTYILEASRYQLEIILFDPATLAEYDPSMIAYAAILNSMEQAEELLSPVQLEEFYSLMMNMHSVLKVDLSQVEILRTRMKHIVPQLPSVNMIEKPARQQTDQTPDHEDEDLTGESEDEDEEVRFGSASPTLVSDLECDEKCRIATKIQRRTLVL